MSTTTNVSPGEQYLIDYLLWRAQYHAMFQAFWPGRYRTPGTTTQLILAPVEEEPKP